MLSSRTRRIYRLADMSLRSRQLIQGKKKENWSLIGAQIKRYYPGLVENQIILFCLVASNEVSMHHVVYILNRTMNQHKRTWRAVMLKQALRTAHGMKRIMQPRFAVSGSGITNANVNLRNEFKVETPFPCPPFTVEVQDSNGEIWRETTSNARIILHRGEEYSSMTDVRHSERPIEIIKVSRLLYKVFYVIRTKGKCKITIRPGIVKGGHIYGSPFTVQADGATLGRNALKEKSMAYQQSSSWKHQMLATSVNENELVRRRKSPTLVNEATQESDKASKPQETLLKSSFFKNFLKKSMDSLMKIFITNSPDLSQKASKKGVKRKTIIDPSLNWPGQQRISVLSNVRQFLPASRRLKIRTVTIHRYINEPMPSLEKYFFGKDYNVDMNGNVSASAEKNHGIMRLIRHSLSTSKDNPEFHSARKNGSIASISGHHRKQRLRREKNVFSPPWSRKKRHSDGKFWSGQTGKWMESSSSSESEAHDSEILRNNKREEMKRTLSEDTYTKSKGPLDHNFRNALHSESGVADMILHGVPSAKSDWKRDDGRRRQSSFTATKSNERNRRSGFTIVKQQSFCQKPENLSAAFIFFVDNQVNIILNSAFEAVVKKLAKSSR